MGIVRAKGIGVKMEQLGRSVVTSLVVLAAVLASCRKTTSEPSQVDAVLGVDGGSMALPLGARLEVPAGSLDSDVAISATRVEPPREDTTLRPVSDFIRFQPAGLKFKRPVRLTWPIPTSVDSQTFANATIVWATIPGYYLPLPTQIDSANRTASTEVMLKEGV